MHVELDLCENREKTNCQNEHSDHGYHGQAMALRFDHCEFTVSSMGGHRELIMNTFYLMSSNQNDFILGQRICN